MQRLLWVSVGGLRKLAQGFVEIARPLGVGNITAMAEDHTKSDFTVKRRSMTAGKLAVVLVESGIHNVDYFHPSQKKTGSSCLTTQSTSRWSMKSSLQPRGIQ